MVALPAPAAPTVAAIYKNYEETRKNDFRTHLGASLIGEDCRAKLWYVFRWVHKTEFNGRQLRLFETGDLAEARFVKNLRDAGVTVMEVNPENGRQWRVSAHGGHFGGSLDGAGVGIVEAPKAWHVFEFKTHSEKSFDKLKKEGVQKSKPLHYAQMQTYMHLTGMDRAFYLAVNKNTDELYSERVHYDKAFAEALLEKAGHVIKSPSPPEKVTTDPSSFLCRFCDFKEVCHGMKSSKERNCRTCLHSTPKLDAEDGVWWCEKYDAPIPPASQAVGCGAHIFIPHLIAGQLVEAGDTWTQYTLADGTQWMDGISSDGVRADLPPV